MNAFKLGIVLANSQISRVPRVLSKIADFNGSSKRTDAAAWKIIVQDLSLSKSSSEIPKFSSMTSPGITVILSNKFDCCFRSGSNNWKYFIKKLNEVANFAY